MKPWRTLSALAALAAALLVLSSCKQDVEPRAPTGSDVVTLQGRTMGTTYSVKVVARSAEESARAVALQARIDERLERVNDQMSTYRPESELERFNRHAATTPFPVSTDTAYVVRRALDIGQKTGGAFDVTLDPLIELWGFDKGARRDTPPPPDEIAEAKARVGTSRVSVEDTALVKDRPDVEVNLSGIAKGYGVDRVYQLLLDEGFTDVMVEIGGEVRARGKNAKGEPWRIGISVPRSTADPTAVLVAVPLTDAALATSGDYRNFFESGGQRYAHILDPGSGEPVRRDLVSASILAADCTTADALATAAIVLGEAKTREVLRAHFPGVEALFVHAPEGEEGSLRVTRTEGFSVVEPAPSQRAPEPR